MIQLLKTPNRLTNANTSSKVTSFGVRIVIRLTVTGSNNGTLKPIVELSETQRFCIQKQN